MRALQSGTGATKYLIQPKHRQDSRLSIFKRLVNWVEKTVNNFRMIGTRYHER
jgi:hypothetical protein